MRLPTHKASLHLSHNEHLGVYETVEQWLSDPARDYEWASDAERQAAIDANEIWTLEWYEHTPVSCHAIAASTLTALLWFASTHWEMQDYT